MSAQLTPGPWEKDAEGGIFMVCSGPDTVVCRGIRNEADANLLAAAPRMLAAIQAEQEWRERERDGAIDPAWNYERMVGDKRRAAIAAATGASS